MIFGNNLSNLEEENWMLVNTTVAQNCITDTVGENKTFPLTWTKPFSSMCGATSGLVSLQQASKNVVETKHETLTPGIQCGFNL